MKIKKGDNVIVTTGKDKGHKGKVVKAFPKEKKVVVEGANKRTVLERRAKQSKRQKIEKEYPIDVSNVMVIDPVKGKPSRVGYKISGDKKIRVALKSGKEIK